MARAVAISIRLSVPYGSPATCWSRKSDEPERFGEQVGPGPQTAFAGHRRAAAEHARHRAVPGLEVLGGDEVLTHGRALHQADVLERATEPERSPLVHGQVSDLLAPVDDAAAVRRVEAGDHVEQRRLAGAVGTDHADDLVLVDGDAHVQVGLDATEADGQVVGLKHGHR